jgi:hypothetical protein
MVLLVLGGQGAVRLLVDRGDPGVLGWLPGGFWSWLVGYVVLVVAGVVLAARSRNAVPE